MVSYLETKNINLASWLPWVAIVIIYNPFFLYQFLMINFNTGGIERAIITIIFYASTLIFCLRLGVNKNLIVDNKNYIYFFCISFLLFSIYAVVSIFLGRELYTILVYVFPLLSFCYLSLFTFFVTNPKKLSKYLDFLSIWVLVMCLFDAYVTYLAYTTDFSFAYNVAVSGTESESSLDDITGNRIPDLLLPIYFSFGIALLYASKSLMRKFLGSCILVLSGLLLIICFWRTAQLAAIISIICFFFYIFFFSENKLKQLKNIFLVFALSFPFIIYFLNYEIIEGFSTFNLLESRILDLMTGKSESGTFRLLSILANLDFSIDYWILGLGFGKLVITSNDDLIILGTSSNYFIDLFVWFGLPLTIIFLYFLLKHVLRTMLYFEKKSIDKRFSLTFLLIIANSFIILCFFPSVVSYPIFELIAVFLGSGARMVYSSKLTSL